MLAGMKHRIIPALAGNTRSPSAPWRRAPDHPRSRGEYLARVDVARGDSGSSPLSRGILFGWGRERVNPRIIPALAGNTGMMRSRCMAPWDHPRSRGEYTITAAQAFGDDGSSPLSRGILDKKFFVCGDVRIIPALAGNTSPLHAGKRLLTDHPRSRGEYLARVYVTRGDAGSSPLSRGILLVQRRVGACDRIIPALAGNTRRVASARAPLRDHPRSRGEYTC